VIQTADLGTEADDRVRALARGFSHHDEGLDVAFDVYKELRERCPVGYSERYGGFWFATRFEDIHRIEQDPETFAVAPAMLLPPMGHVRPGIPIDIDPPMHPKYRRLMLPAFAPQQIDDMEPMVRRTAIQLLDAFSGEREVDVSERFAVPLPMIVFCELAGLPTDESERLEDWINRIFYVRTHDYADTERAAEECCAYLASIFESRKGEPPRDDLFGRLLTSKVDGRPLSDEELVDYGFVLLTAGLDTTAWVIRSSLWHLAQHPEDRAKLAVSPGLVATAMEEFLRCLSSVQGMARTATRDVELDGHTVRKGERVLLLFGAGNRDEAKFPDGDTVTIDRQPNPHFAFGVGIHRCLGSNLARREVRIALEEFLVRYPEFSLAPDSDPPWHGISPLPLVLSVEDGR
jgi:cytochrome P450